MAEAVKLSDIKYVVREDTPGVHAETPMLPGEIPGALVTNYSLIAGDHVQYAGQNQHIDIYFLCDGDVGFCSRGVEYRYAQKAVFVDLPWQDVAIKAYADSNLLRVTWDMNEQDIADLHGNEAAFPIQEAYEDAVQYRDFFKSETTISRAIIKQTVIPRFAMGSVEANADDLVGMHSHPLLDQFFYSFEENDMDLLIDCRILNMKGNTLLHIPLGSNHGIIAKGDQKMHYLWLDFTPQHLKDDAVAYLNEVHKPTGVKQSL